MNNKLILISMIVFLLLPVSIIAETGVGAAFFFTEDDIGGAALNISHPKIPGTILGLRAQFGDDVTTIGIYDDWWLYHAKLAGAVSWYIGPGFYVNAVLVEDGDSSVDFGGRLPIGLRFFPVKPIELFIEIAPTLGVYPELPDFGWQGALGIRFWF